MIATAFDEENCVLDPPTGMSQEECTSLSVYRGPDAAGTPLVISCWKFTKEEWEEVQKTGRVWITIIGTTMPPILPSVRNPFQHG